MKDKAYWRKELPWIAAKLVLTVFLLGYALVPILLLWPKGGASLGMPELAFALLVVYQIVIVPWTVCMILFAWREL